MERIFDTCKPRAEVLKGELREQQFAASLTAVMAPGPPPDANDVYRDAHAFYANTYATSGLKTLLREALGRLTGVKPDSSPIVRLETSFGGGKTHSLIALYHVCTAKPDPGLLASFVSRELLPRAPIRKIAGIVGPDLEGASGIQHGTTTVQTPWGEIAWQLGGEKGYALARADDEARTAPGTGLWKRLIGDDPCLIMIDEIAYYLRVARGREYAVGRSTLAEQTVAFLMSLLKFAAESPRTVVVLTLAESSDAFGRESDELREELAESRSLSARQEFVLSPTAANEISGIVTHRLFEHIDRSRAEQTADAYLAYFHEQVKRNVDLPPRATRAEYRNEIVTDYPFHPELLTTLHCKTSTIHNFQQTRGALAVRRKSRLTVSPRGARLPTILDVEGHGGRGHGAGAAESGAADEFLGSHRGPAAVAGASLLRAAESGSGGRGLRPVL